IKGIDADTYATGANNGTNLTFENVDYVGGNDEADILANTGAGPDAAWLEVLGTQTPGTGAAFGNFAWTYWTTFSSFADGTLSVELVEENVVSFRLYPNPFNNEINVSSSKSINVISIYNTVGQQVLRKTNTNRVDVSSLKNGLYLVKVEAGDSIYVGKMLK
uniref:T9SS type A sorting domain-containing protein n=1 Tax=Winogradskyella sp. TaxID=1883156 RepID=UPI0035141C89